MDPASGRIASDESASGLSVPFATRRGEPQSHMFDQRQRHQHEGVFERVRAQAARPAARR